MLRTTKPAAAAAESVSVVAFFLVGSVRAMNSQVTPHTPLLANRMKKTAGAGVHENSQKRYVGKVQMFQMQMPVVHCLPEVRRRSLSRLLRIRGADRTPR